MVFAYGITGGCVSDVAPPVATNGYETDCESDTPPITSGGTYGPVWQAPAEDTTTGPGADGSSDGGGPGFDIPPPVSTPDDDPTSWTYDATEDTYYRSPTDLEMANHEWLSPEDLLVIPPRTVLADLSDGDGTADLPIPMHEELQGRPQTGLSFRTLTLGRTGTQTNVPFIEQRWEDDCLRRTTLEATFHFYESRGFDPTDIDVESVVGSTISSPDRDSLAVLGATRDRYFSLRGPYSPNRVPLELGLPSEKVVFHVLSTEYDPNPEILLGSASGSPLRRDSGEASSFTGEQGPLSGQNPETCYDGVLNGDETDVDCGGCCTACELGKSCIESGDCISRFCTSGICASQCADGLDNDEDGFADSCDFSCVEHPDFGTLTTVHNNPLEHAKTVGQFGTMNYCTVNEASYLSSFIEWSSAGMLLINNVVPDDPSVSYAPGDGPPPFRVVMRGCVIADDPVIAAACDRQVDACPADFVGYPLASEISSNWGSANNTGLGTATGVLGKVWSLVDYTIEDGVVTDTVPLHIAVAYPLERDSNQPENGVAVAYQGSGTPATAGAIVSYWDNTFVGQNLAHEIGHTIGLDHEDSIDGEGSFYPGTSTRGFMSGPIGGPAPVLDVDADSAVPPLDQWDAWLQAGSKEVPRASGFSFQGCNNDDAVCQNGHPGLICDPNTQTCR